MDRSDDAGLAMEVKWLLLKTPSKDNTGGFSFSPLPFSFERSVNSRVTRQ